MNPQLKDQIQKLITTYPSKVDDKITDVLPESFNTVLFMHDLNDKGGYTEIKVTFSDYIINPFDGFDFHDKFNHGVKPYDKVMYGTIVKETEKMYYFRLHSAYSDKIWEGYCPKKSCVVTY